MVDQTYRRAVPSARSIEGIDLDTCTRINVNDKEIILVPTAHISQESVELVKQIIETERPDSVCIELDKNRYENLKNPKAWEQTDLVKVIKEKRVWFMLANLLLGSYQKRLAEKLGTKVGGEMIQAIESAEEIDAEIVLADRDIQTTFQRIWRMMKFKEKVTLLSSLILPEDDEEDGEFSEEDIRELLKSDMLEGMLSDVEKDLPQVGQVLIHERDQYLSQKIKNAPGKKVVAVLGGAHIPGVSKEIHKDINIEPLTALPRKKPIGKIIGWAIPIIIIGLLIYAFVANLDTGVQSLGSWVLWTGGLSALFTLIVTRHPLTVLTSFFLAPFTTLNPAIAVGWFSGLVQAIVQKPTVKDLQNAQTDIFSLKGFFSNKVIKVLLVVIFANIGGSIGTFVAGADIITNIFG